MQVLPVLVTVHSQLYPAPQIFSFLGLIELPECPILLKLPGVTPQFRINYEGCQLGSVRTFDHFDLHRSITSNIWAALSRQIGPLEDSDLSLTTQVKKDEDTDKASGFCILGRHSRLSVTGRDNLTHLSAYFLQFWRGRTIQFRQFLLFPSSAGIQQHPARWLTSSPWLVSFVSQYGSLFCTKAHMWKLAILLWKNSWRQKSFSEVCRQESTESPENHLKITLNRCTDQQW